MEPGTSPRTVSSKRKVVYTKSSWNVHEFVVFSGEPLCRVAALRMKDSLLLWVGREGDRRLGEVALGMPAEKLEGGALATTLLEGGVPETGALALRVAAGLKQPVFACCALPLDRLSAPLLERGLANEINARPHCFYDVSYLEDWIEPIEDKDSEVQNNTEMVKKDDKYKNKEENKDLETTEDEEKTQDIDKIVIIDI